MLLVREWKTGGDLVRFASEFIVMALRLLPYSDGRRSLMVTKYKWCRFYSTECAHGSCWPWLYPCIIMFNTIFYGWQWESVFPMLSFCFLCWRWYCIHIVCWIITPFGRTMALGLTQPLTDINTRNISREGGGGVGLTTLPPSCADCLEIWEPQLPGTLRACTGCTGVALLYFLHYYYFITSCLFCHQLSIRYVSSPQKI
jgi:hypothetical protein